MSDMNDINGLLETLNKIQGMASTIQKQEGEIAGLNEKLTGLEDLLANTKAANEELLVKNNWLEDKVSELENEVKNAGPDEKTQEFRNQVKALAERLVEITSETGEEEGDLRNTPSNFRC